MKKIIMILICVMLCSHTKINALEKETQPVYWTIFDSLGDGGIWQGYFSNVTSFKFYPSVNHNFISSGGTPTSIDNRLSTLWRARNLVSLKDKYPIDMVFIENINDLAYVDYYGNLKGSIEDTPFMPSCMFSVPIEKPCSSLSEASEYFKKNIADITNSFENYDMKKGMVFIVPYFANNVRGKNVVVKNVPRKEGDINIRVSDANLKLHVSPDMTIDEICDLLCNSFWGYGWTCTHSGIGSVNFSYWTNTDFSNLVYSDGDSGLELQFEDSYKVLESCWCCMDENNFGNLESWSNNVSIYSMYKGLIEYLKEELPDTELFWFIPTRFYVDFNSNYLKDENGNWSSEKYKSTPEYYRYKKLVECQKNVSEFYGIQVADIESRSGIAIENIETYYNPNDVHPKTIGYERWANTLAKMFEDGTLTSMSMNKVVIHDNCTEYSHSQAQHKDISYIRNFANSNWQALYVPFIINYNDWKDNFEVAYIQNVNQYDDDEDGTIDRTVMEVIKMKEGKSIEPNTPYLIRAKTTGEKTITLEDATLYKTEETTYSVTSWYNSFNFVGTYHLIFDMATKGYYAMSDGVLKKATSNVATLQPFRWYLSVTDRDGNPVTLDSKSLSVVFDDGEATGIETISNGVKGSTSIHTLTGISKGNDVKSLAPSIYIRNKRKFIVK